MGFPQLASTAAAIDDPARGVVSMALLTIGESAEEVSIAIGAPRNFLRSYLERGWPRTLPPRLRRKLAAHIGIAEHALR
jgi:hypothetical protein